MSEEVEGLVDAFFGTEGLKPEYSELRSSVLNRLLAEHPHVDTMDQILLERVSYSYARIRQREAAGMFGSERNYKAALSMLTAFMQETRKSENREQLLELIRADAIDVVVKSLKEAVTDLAEDDQQKVLGTVLQLVHDDPETPDAAKDAG